MKHKINTLLVALFISVSGACVVASATSQPAYAACNTDNSSTSIGNAEEGDCAKETSFEFNNKNSDVGINDLVVEVLRFLSIAVGIAVVAGITVGGIVYSMSRGNPSNTQKGVKIITNSVIGLILYLLMFAIINFLVPGGILS